MIELTPREVEACRRLKSYTEKQLAQELYDAIEKPDANDRSSREFMKHVREMCDYALNYLKKIITLLKDAKLKDDNGINDMIWEAGPLAVYYAASNDCGGRDNRIQDVEKKRDDKIKTYKDNIRTLEEKERDLNKYINTKLLTNIRKKKCSSGDFDGAKLAEGGLDKFVSIDTMDVIKSYNGLLDKMKGMAKNQLNTKILIDGTDENDGYFELKKHLDLEISRLYNKIEWQKDYAEALKRQAVSDNCFRKLKAGHIDSLIAKIDELSPSDCSDIFRLLGTMMEELDKFDKADWEKLNEHYAEGVVKKEIDLDHLRFCIQLQTILRETSGLDVKTLFPEMPLKLAKHIKMPEEYQIDRGERFAKCCEICRKPNQVNRAGTKCRVHGDVKIIDMVEQELECTKCGSRVRLYLEPGRHSREKPIPYPCRGANCKASKGWWCYTCMKERKHSEVKTLAPSMTGRLSPTTCCNKCGQPVSVQKISTFKPVYASREEGGVKPFWKDDIRARWRDTWSSTFILEYNSIVRAIDRTFGLPEGADISGTTADSIFGMEAVMHLSGKGQESIGTKKDEGEFQVKEEYWSEHYKASGGYPGYVILLPLITMVKHGHHALLECALTFMLTGYIDAYHIGYYTTLWPKGSAGSGKLWEILEKWEDSKSNPRILIERDEDGFVTGGWLFETGEKLSGFEFSEVVELNYHRYVNIFMPLRDAMKEKHKINKLYFTALMMQDRDDLYDLELKILDENGKRLQDWADENGKYENYDEFAEGLKEYSEKDSKNPSFKEDLVTLSADYPKHE